MEKNPQLAVFPRELLAREPFRLFFPAATLSGIIGVALWPLHLLGITPDYPGEIHARIMTHGLFGGFILGFLGTALPRMLSAASLRGFETGLLLLAYTSMVAGYIFGRLPLGNGLFIALFLAFALVMLPRILHRRDNPPPGFILVALSLACAMAGALLKLFEAADEPGIFCLTLQKLLTYQGFVLLPILGIGPFILPRFFGLESPHNFPESIKPTRAWSTKAFLALAAGTVVIATFFMEANGWIRLAYGIRFATTFAYMLLEMPLKPAPASANVFSLSIRIALTAIPSGFLAIAFFPGYRVGLLHLTLIGGFSVITLVVATRVLFGHSGILSLLKKTNRWFPIALALMLSGMATRISGDFWPKIMASHYIYGALLWIAGVLLWAIYALPKIVVGDKE